jgi:hypothetical protein
MIPRWLVDKRIAICLSCYQRTGCVARFQILSEAPTCPLNKLPSKADEIAAKAWPEGAPQASGCCDAAENYL